MPTQDALNTALLVLALVVGAVVLLPRRRTDHRPWGLRPDRGSPGRYLLGVVLAVAATGASYVVLLATGLTDTTSGAPEAGELASIVVFFVLLSAVEELLFRGLLVNGIIELTGRTVVAVLIVAVAVAVPYLFAEGGVTPLSAVSAVLAGVMYGVVFLVCRSVWAAAGMRTAWNVVLGPVLGFDVSGESLVDHPVLAQDLDGPDWLTGGAYGPEGGVVVIAARVAVIAALLWWSVRTQRDRGGSPATRHGSATLATTAYRSVAVVATMSLAVAGCSGTGEGGSDEPTSTSAAPSDTPDDKADDSADAPLEIDTTTGTLRGRVSGATRQFLGVRYAQAPVGQRRWTLPEPPPDTDEVLDATSSGPSCPQAGDIALSATGPTSEDCLFLEVTTPRRASDEPWPVMVWWHGGGFTSGAGSQYDAQRLADEGDVAVVTVSYRLGMLGYLGLPGLEGSGDFGLADQLAGLRWADDNAEAFGGDPDNVTVFGESAGGTSVCAALTSPAARGLVDRAIFSSGSCRLAWPKGTLFPEVPASRSLIPLTESEGLGTAAAQAVGCKGEDPLACLRAKPVKALVSQAELFGNPLTYGTDLLPQDPATAIEQGDVLDVPVISGGNRDEHRSFVGGLLLAQPDAITAETWPALLRASFGTDAAAVQEQYPLGDYDSAPLAWSTLVTDVAWACTTTRGARELAATGSTVYSYEFADETAPDVSGVASSGLPQGAAHATDLPYLFDLGGKSLLTTPEQERLAATMVQLWTSFAHTGRPSAEGVDWPATTADDAPVLELGPDVAIGDHAQRHRCDFWASLDLP